jgi:hypothetical protein
MFPVLRRENNLIDAVPIVTASYGPIIPFGGICGKVPEESGLVKPSSRVPRPAIILRS